ncbi:MAG: FAD-binding oxidoreductase [Alphaproteobacteria bacterium]|nr:FAD-binding oxidoreductase [Alphaproteobacteria bacterium]
MTDTIFTDDFQVKPYWWEAAPPEDARDALPEAVDAAIVGSGYCGLIAAIELARGGLRVAVLDAGPLGFGASTRSGGMVSSGQKLVITGAYKIFGEGNAERVFAESKASFDFITSFIAREGLDADYQHCGRFFGAYVGRDYATLAHHAALLTARTGVTTRLIPAAEQRSEIGSDFFHGGMVVDDYGGLHPAKYNRALRNLARQAGVSLHSHARVLGTAPDAAGHVVTTERGRLKAREVVIATNGYTDRAVPFLRRRIIPVASYIVATEELPQAVMDEIMPKRRMMSDTRRELDYFRPSPDGRRLLFGCRPSFRDKDERTIAQGSYRRICQIFPQLSGYRLSHVWKGFVGMTFDKVPHMGTHEGVHYAMGCNGNGVAIASYLGHQTALKILGRQNRPCIFDARPFPTNPFYTGVPWMVPLASIYYHARDALARPGAALNFL